MLFEVFCAVSALALLSVFSLHDCKEQLFACEKTDAGDLSREHTTVLLLSGYLMI